MTNAIPHKRAPPLERLISSGNQAFYSRPQTDFESFSIKTHYSTSQRSFTSYETLCYLVRLQHQVYILRMYNHRYLTKTDYDEQVGMFTLHLLTVTLDTGATPKALPSSTQSTSPSSFLCQTSPCPPPLPSI